MSVDIKYLKSRGVSAEAYKKIFSQPRDRWPDSCKRLMEHVSARIETGRMLNLKEWRAYAAIDQAYEVPFNQTVPTLIQHILSQHLDEQATIEALKGWGLSEEELFIKVPTDGGTAMILNQPVFYQIFVPVVKAYTTIRLSKIFNERNRNPLLQYNPLKQIEEDQILCEVITDLINTISRNYGYAATLKQAILQALKYGICLSFPMEEWHEDKQEVWTGEYKADGSPASKVITIREGLRYLLPDPTRMYWDLAHPLSTINTDTGASYAGHWRVLTFADIYDSKVFWNRKSIYGGRNWFKSPYAGQYFSEVFPCQVMAMPDACYWEETKRDDKAAYYTKADRDKAIFVTEHFEKLVPRDWGLGDYKYPVWHRFTVAADDTPLYIAPCAYTPSWFMGYDFDDNSAKTSSLSLELIPWQDHIGNLLSQSILTAKQNLTKVIFYDNQQIDPKVIESLNNRGEQRYKAIQYVPFDPLASRAAMHDKKEAFIPVTLAQASIVEMLQLIPVSLNIMERVLQISAQEAGSAASHQQSKAEIIQTGNAGTNRIAFTASFIDDGIDAWERQIYMAAMTYMDPAISAQISTDIPNVLEVLDRLGFTVDRKGREKIVVSGHKHQLRLEGFAKSNQGVETESDAQTAQVLFQVIGVIAQQPALATKFEKIIPQMLELGARLASPRLASQNFRLRPPPNGQGGQVDPQILQAIQMAQQATAKAINEKLGQPLAKGLAEDQQQIAQLQQTVQALSKLGEQVQAMIDKNALAAREAQQSAEIRQAEASQKMQLEQAEFQAEQVRKQQEHEAEMQRDAEKARLQLEAKQLETQQNLQAKEREAEVKLEAAKKAAAAKADGAAKAAKAKK